MTSSNFETHRQKYIGFGIVAIFVITVSYAVYRSDALSLPFETGFLQGRRVLGCPPAPVLMRLRNRFPPNHPCFQAALNENLPVLEEQITIASSVDTSTSTATATPEATTSTESSSSDSTATTTPETPTSTEESALSVPSDTPSASASSTE